MLEELHAIRVALESMTARLDALAARIVDSPATPTSAVGETPDERRRRLARERAARCRSARRSSPPPPPPPSVTPSVTPSDVADLPSVTPSVTERDAGDPPVTPSVTPSVTERDAGDPPVTPSVTPSVTRHADAPTCARAPAPATRPLRSPAGLLLSSDLSDLEISSSSLPLLTSAASVISPGISSGSSSPPARVARTVPTVVGDAPPPGARDHGRRTDRATWSAVDQCAAAHRLLGGASPSWAPKSQSGTIPTTHHRYLAYDGCDRAMRRAQELVQASLVAGERSAVTVSARIALVVDAYRAFYATGSPFATWPKVARAHVEAVVRDQRDTEARALADARDEARRAALPDPRQLAGQVRAAAASLARPHAISKPRKAASR